VELRNVFSGFKRALCVLAAIAAVPFVSAGLTDVIFHIEATSNEGTAVYELTMDDMGWQRSQDQWDFSSDQTVVVKAENGQTVFTLSDVSLFFRADPQINLSFSVQAGNSDTAFTISSALLSFPTINNAQGQASSAFTVTDTNNNGATLTGTNGDGNGYNTFYNGYLSNLFVGQIPSVTVPAGTSSKSDSANYPAAGYAAVGADVSDMSAQVKFSLTAKDLASGTTQYEIVPEPSALVLLALGGLSMIRRRK
jgi:hypothetical protein